MSGPPMKCDIVGLFYNLLNEMAMSISYFSEKRKKAWWTFMVDIKELGFKGGT